MEFNHQINGKQCGVAPSQDSDTLFVGNINKTWTKAAVSVLAPLDLYLEIYVSVFAYLDTFFYTIVEGEACILQC